MHVSAPQRPIQGRRVVVTGIGALSPNGSGREEFWTATRAGKSGVRRITEFDVDHLPTRIAGTVQGGTAWLLGSSYALALGLIAGFLDLIPNLGATIAGFILVPTLWAEQGIGAAVIMLVVVLVYQQLENNILTPKIQGKAVDLSAFFIIVSVTLFGALLGVLGALTAVPLAAMIQIFVQELTRARRERVAELKAIASRSPTTT